MRCYIRNDLFLRCLPLVFANLYSLGILPKTNGDFHSKA